MAITAPPMEYHIMLFPETLKIFGVIVGEGVGSGKFIDTDGVGICVGENVGKEVMLGEGEDVGERLAEGFGASVG